MEYGHGAAWNEQSYGDKKVLILLLMEYGHGDGLIFPINLHSVTS